MKCDNKLNYSNSVEKRFVLLDRLTYVRNKLNKCVTGYNQSYKDNSAITRVFTCKEGINMMLLDGYTITPDFPYPRVSTYYNCYPYNISEKIKSTCFENKDKPGSAENPGCPMLTQDYMDNYYCCE
jgi:hypothetical protein